METCAHAASCLLAAPGRLTPHLAHLYLRVAADKGALVHALRSPPGLGMARTRRPALAGRRALRPCRCGRVARASTAQVRAWPGTWRHLARRAAPGWLWHLCAYMEMPSATVCPQQCHQPWCAFAHPHVSAGAGQPPEAALAWTQIVWKARLSGPAGWKCTNAQRCARACRRLSHSHVHGGCKQWFCWLRRCRCPARLTSCARCSPFSSPSGHLPGGMRPGRLPRRRPCGLLLSGELRTCDPVHSRGCRSLPAAEHAVSMVPEVPPVLLRCCSLSLAWNGKPAAQTCMLSSVRLLPRRPATCRASSSRMCELEHPSWAGGEQAAMVLDGRLQR